MSCTQSISYGQNNAFLNYLSNCEADTIYAPLILDQNDTFYYVSGRNGKQISILKEGFEVILQGDLFNDPNAAIPQLLTMLATVNSNSPCCESGVFALDTAHIVQDVDQLLQIHPADAQNRIPLGNNTYYFDSLDFKLDGYTLFIPSATTDVQIAGFSQQTNKISSSDDGISMIEVEGASGVTIKNIKLEITSATSQAILMNDGSGNSSLDLLVVEFTENTTWGQLVNCRQVLMEGCFSVNSRKGFSLSGSSFGGFKIDNCRIINCGVYIVGEDESVGALPLVMNNLRGDVNATIAVGDVAFSFVEANFGVDGAFAIANGRFNGDGEMAKDFAVGLPAENSVKSLLSGNQGVKGKNSFPGIYWQTTVEVLTAITTSGTIYKLLGTTVAENEVYLEQTSDNVVTHQSELNFSYIVGGSVTIDGNRDRVLKLYLVRKPLGGSDEIIRTYTGEVGNYQGSEDSINFNFVYPNLKLSQGDELTLKISNETDNTNVTMKIGSIFYAYKA